MPEEIKKQKTYDLEGRCFVFAKKVREFINKLPRTLANTEDAKQLIRSSGSIGANYIEANESLGKKDFVMRIKISRKEAKESNYWLNLLEIKSALGLEDERADLVSEAMQLVMIFNSIAMKFK